MGRGRRLELSVVGMTCGACSGAVERAIGSLGASVRSVSVSLLLHSAVVVTDGLLRDAEVVSAVEDAGFEASLRRSEDEGEAHAELASLRLQLLSLPDGDVEAALHLLRGCRGVTSAQSEAASPLALPTATVQFDPQLTGPRHLLRALRCARCEARLAPSSHADASEGAPFVPRM